MMIYEEIIRRVEKWSEVIYHVMYHVTPGGWVFPKFVACIFIYFTTEADSRDDDVLELPLPLWLDQ